jgi:hypothetical protein
MIVVLIIQIMKTIRRRDRKYKWRICNLFEFCYKTFGVDFGTKTQQRKCIRMTRGMEREERFLPKIRRWTHNKYKDRQAVKYKPQKGKPLKKTFKKQELQKSHNSQ